MSLSMPMALPDVSVPDLEVRVNGLPLPLAARADLESVTVTDDVDGLSMFELSLHNWDQDALEVSWSDSALFALGGEVAIALGTVDNLHRVMLGEITSLEPSFSADAPPMLTVRGYDHRHRLARGVRTRTFSQVTDSAIARRVATDAGLRAQVTATTITLDYVVQHNQTDLEFLRRRAELIGYEVYVRDKVLYFGPPQHAAAPTATLSIGREISEFTPRLRSLDQVGAVTVRGWDAAQKQVIVGSARTGQEGETMGGAVSGPGQSVRAFGPSAATDVTTPVRTKGRADQIALGRFGDRALQFIEGEVACGGAPELRAGSALEIRGAGRTFSGTYYVAVVTHTMSPTDGFATRIDVRRNAS